MCSRQHWLLCGSGASPNLSVRPATTAPATKPAQPSYGSSLDGPLLIGLYGGVVGGYESQVHNQEPQQRQAKGGREHKAHKGQDGPAAQSGRPTGFAGEGCRAWGLGKGLSAPMGQQGAVRRGKQQPWIGTRMSRNTAQHGTAHHGAEPDQPLYQPQPSPAAHLPTCVSCWKLKKSMQGFISSPALRATWESHGHVTLRAIEAVNFIGGPILAPTHALEAPWLRCSRQGTAGTGCIGSALPRHSSVPLPHNPSPRHRHAT